MRWHVKQLSLHLLIVFTLSGCVDYKWGKHWGAVDNNQWLQSPNRSKRGYEPVRSQAQCNGQLLEFLINAEAGQQVISVFFVPLFPNLNPPKTEVNLVMSHKNAAKVCDEFKKDVFDISINGTKTDSFRLSVILNTPYQIYDNRCYLSVDLPAEGERIVTLGVNPKIMNCEIEPLIIYESDYFCTRGTRFGGSPPCY